MYVAALVKCLCIYISCNVRGDHDKVLNGNE